MSKRNDKESINILQDLKGIADSRPHNPEDILPIFNAMREESQHALSIIDSLFDKLLDLAKLLITVSATALAGLYPYLLNLNKSDKTDRSAVIVLAFSITAFAIGSIIFFFSLHYKNKYLPGYLKSSISRNHTYIILISELISKNLDAKNKKK